MLLRPPTMQLRPPKMQSRSLTMWVWPIEQLTRPFKSLAGPQGCIPSVWVQSASETKTRVQRDVLVLKHIAPIKIDSCVVVSSLGVSRRGGTWDGKS